MWARVPRRIARARPGGQGMNLLLALPAAVLLPAAARAQEGGAAAVPETVGGGALDWLDRYLHLAGRLIEVAGIGVIVLGAVVATLLYLRRLASSGASPRAYEAYRANLGRGILLGLELLVAADIIGTVAVDPTLYNLGVLAAIVLIRTFLSFSLEVEIEGRWPWQAAKAENVANRDAAPRERL